MKHRVTSADAPRLLGGALFVCLALLASSPAHAEDATEMLVRIDDRRARSLSYPWVTVVLASGGAVRVPVLDDGTDTIDRFAGDRLYVGRIEVLGTGEATVVVSDGGPAGVGKLVDEWVVELRPGHTLRFFTGKRPQFRTSSTPTTLQSSSTKSQGTPASAATNDNGPWFSEPNTFKGTDWDMRPMTLLASSLALIGLARLRRRGLRRGLAGRLSELARVLSRARP